MEVKKAIKKIIALGTGATMLAATMAGALAADLSNYPEPFAKNGAFDGLIVIGQKAQGADVVGAVDIGASMQYSVKQETTTSVETSTSTVAEGMKIEKSGEQLNFLENVTTIQDTPLDNSNLPTILKDGIFDENEGTTENDDVDYEQTLRFGANTLELVYESEETSGDDVAGDYLKLVDGNLLYSYLLDFSEDVDFVNATNCRSATADDNDFEGATLEIQGNVYTVTKAECVASGTNKWTMMAGETTLWLTQDQVLTKTVDGTEHTVQVTDVNEDATKCGISVDGTVVWIDKSSSDTINGVKIGVLDAVSVHSQLQDQDICQLSVGSRQLTFEDANEVEIDGKDVDGSNVDFIMTDGNSLKKIQINYTPDDDVWMSAGDSWTDPVLGNFKITYGGLTQKTEQIDISTSSSSAKITFMNADNDKVEIPMATNKSYVAWGNDDYKDFLFTDAANVSQQKDCKLTDNDKKDCKGSLLLMSTSGEVPHMLEITSLSEETSSNKTKIKDLQSGNEYSSDFTYAWGHGADGAMGGCNSTNTTKVNGIALGALGTIKLCFSTDGNMTAYDLQLGDLPETKYGLGINLTGTYGSFFNANGRTAVADIAFMEEVWDETDVTRAKFNVSFAYDTLTDKQIEISAFTKLDATNWADSTGLAPSDTDDNNKIYVTRAGTKIVKDDDSPINSMSITYPDEAVYGSVYIAPASAEVQITTTSGVPVYLSKINVGSAKLDNEISSVSAQNLIIVGGPCANSVAAEVMGVGYQKEPDCYAGFEAGKAMIKLYNTGAGKYALLVAGMAADDTRAATRVLSQPDKYKMSGSEVEVTYTSLNDIKVSAPKTQ